MSSGRAFQGLCKDAAFESTLFVVLTSNLSLHSLLRVSRKEFVLKNVFRYLDFDFKNFTDKSYVTDQRNQHSYRHLLEEASD